MIGKTNYIWNVFIIRWLFFSFVWNGFYTVIIKLFAGRMIKHNLFGLCYTVYNSSICFPALMKFEEK